jgi:hypothetical protein
MQENRRSFLRKAITLSGGVIAAASLPTSAFAGCKTEIRHIVLDGNLTATTPDWKLGDCELKDFSMQLKEPAKDILDGRFTANVATHFTHTKDVWHLHLQLVAVDDQKKVPSVVLFDRSWDSPPMSEKDNPLFHPWSNEIRFPVGAVKFKGHIEGTLTSCC